MTEADTRAYVGTELELFAGATHWKSYMAERIRPHLGRRVLEVGAGLGGTTAYLRHDSIEGWTCLEPDPELAAAIPCADPSIEVVRGTLTALEPTRRFDSIVYIDVLEHIEDDRGEIHRAWDHLAAGGRLIVLAPAYESMMSEFDRAIGHFRRYTRRTLLATAPADAIPVTVEYLDMVGLLATLANKIILRSRYPNRSQIAFWDNTLVPLSRWGDRIVGYRVGRSVLGVWRKP